MLLFETLLYNNSQIFKNVPECEEGEANKETKGASDVWYQRDNVVGDNLRISQNVLGKGTEEKERLLMPENGEGGPCPNFRPFLANYIFGELTVSKTAPRMKMAIFTVLNFAK